MALQHIVYAPLDRPDVEVLWEGVWCPGELMQWVQADDGSWWASVTYRRPDGMGAQTRFAAERVRPDTVDRSYGRSVGGGS